MAPMKVALVAAVAMQMSSCLSFAADQNQNPNENQNQIANRGMWQGLSFFGDDFFGRSFFDSMTGFMSSLDFGRNFRRSGAPSLSLLPVEDEEKTCRVKIDMSKGVTINNMNLKLNLTDRVLLAAFDLKEVIEESGPNGSHSKRSQQVHLKNSVSLPQTCIATAGAVNAHLVGYVLDNVSEDASAEHHGMIIMPSGELLKEYISQNLLPENVIELVSSGNREELENLTSQQICLAAGFKVAECEKLGNVKPEIAAGTGPVESADEISVPMYNVSLSQFL